MWGRSSSALQETENDQHGLDTGVAGFDLLVMLSTDVIDVTTHVIKPRITLTIMRLGTEVCPDLHDIYGAAGLPSSIASLCVTSQTSSTVGLGGLSPVPVQPVTVGTKFAENLSVFAVFPFDAFNNEINPGGAIPNLFLGYQTRKVNDQPGGVAPVKEKMVFIPQLFDHNGVLSSLNGTNHTFEVDLNTYHPDNPMRLIGGTFDSLGQTIRYPTGISTYLATAGGKVPEHINIALDVAESTWPNRRCSADPATAVTTCSTRPARPLSCKPITLRTKARSGRSTSFKRP